MGYGKIWESAFTGSMIGSGPTVFAVWAYAIAHCRDSSVELNPALLAAIIGTTVEDVERAIAKLEAPDPKSRNQEHDGRRLIFEGGFMYHMTGYKLYRQARDDDAKREYMRKYMRDRRANKSNPVLKDVSEKLASVGVSEAEAEAEAVTSTSLSPAATRDRSAEDELFEEAWQHYPKRHDGSKGSKADALKQWRNRRRAGVAAEAMVDGTKRYAMWCGVTKTGDDARYIMRAERFFGPGKHFDEPWERPVGEDGLPMMTDAEIIAQVKAEVAKEREIEQREAEAQAKRFDQMAIEWEKKHRTTEQEGG